jgi:hypothetical protein
MILPVIFSAASLILCGFFFVYFRAWLGSRMGRDEKLARYREEVNRLIVAIDTATDRDAAIAEDRIQTLKNLIVEADEKIAAMIGEREEQKKQRALHASAAYAALGRSRPPVEAETASAPETAEPVPAGETALPGVLAPASSAAGAEGQQPGAAGTLPASRSFAEEVVELAALGLSAELIARKLEASLSEVDLAMKIRGNRPPGGRSF